MQLNRVVSDKWSSVTNLPCVETLEEHGHVFLVHVGRPNRDHRNNQVGNTKCEFTKCSCGNLQLGKIEAASN